MTIAASAQDLLSRLVDADKALRPKRESFRVALTSSNKVNVYHSEFRDLVSRQDMDDLVDAKFLRKRVERSRFSGRGGHSHTVEHWYVDVTAAGSEHVALLARASSPAAVSGTLDWERDVFPILAAVHEAGGDPALGPTQAEINAVLGRPEASDETDRVLHELVRTGYLEVTLRGTQTLGPERARLTRDGFEMVAGWPSSPADAALTRMLAIIDERIDAATEPDERSKLRLLRDGLLGAGRDVVVGVITALTTTAAKGAVD